MPRTGRRPGRSGTREAILEAARVVFGRAGYERATIRAVAGEAGVDPALVHHFFDNKEGLFIAAMRLPFDPDIIVAAVTEGDPEGVGERIASLLLQVWDNAETRNPLLGLVRSAVSNEDAAAMLREFMTATILERVAGKLGVPDARLRASLVASQIIGLAIGRYIVKIEPLASAPRATLIAALAPTFQRYLTGDLGTGTG